MRTRLATMTEIWANLNSITRRKVIKLQESLRCKRESESLKPWTSIFWTLTSARLSVPFTCSLLFAMWWEMQPRQLGCWILSPRLTDALPANRAANRNEITTTSIYTFHVLSSLDAESFLSLRPAHEVPPTSSSRSQGHGQYWQARLSVLRAGSLTFTTSTASTNATLALLVWFKNVKLTKTFGIFP